MSTCEAPVPLMTHSKATAKNFAYSSGKPQINATKELPSGGGL